MRTYIIILSNIPNEESDNKFGKYINDNKLDYWRYTPLNYIILTPDFITTTVLILELRNAYGSMFLSVLEIDIKDVGGIFPSNSEFDGWTPFQWFKKIRDPKFIPRWEKEKIKGSNI